MAKPIHTPVRPCSGAPRISDATLSAALSCSARPTSSTSCSTTTIATASTELAAQAVALRPASSKSCSTAIDNINISTSSTPLHTAVCRGGPGGRCGGDANDRRVDGRGSGSFISGGRGNSSCFDLQPAQPMFEGSADDCASVHGVRGHGPLLSEAAVCDLRELPDTGKGGLVHLDLSSCMGICGQPFFDMLSLPRQEPQSHPGGVQNQQHRASYTPEAQQQSQATPGWQSISAAAAAAAAGAAAAAARSSQHAYASTCALYHYSTQQPVQPPHPHCRTFESLLCAVRATQSTLCSRTLHLHTLKLSHCARLSESALQAACVACPHLSVLAVQDVGRAFTQACFEVRCVRGVVGDLCIECRVGQNLMYTPYIRSSPQGFSAIYGVYIQYWPTLIKWCVGLYDVVPGHIVVED
jgi:hypothetical protein